MGCELEGAVISLEYVKFNRFILSTFPLNKPGLSELMIYNTLWNVLVAVCDIFVL
jgi:hypothetical protein